MKKLLFTLLTIGLLLNQGTTPQTQAQATTSNYVLLELTNLQAGEVKDVSTYRYSSTATTESALVLSGTIYNAGTRYFNNQEEDPLNPNEITATRQWQGGINCGESINPVTSEFEGTLNLASLKAKETQTIEAHLFNGTALATALKSGRTVDCSLYTLVGSYANIQLDPAYSSTYAFSIYLDTSSNTYRTTPLTATNPFGAPLTTGTNECTSTVIIENGKFTIELIAENGIRSADCRFTEWDIQTISGDHKLLEMTEYTLIFDNNLKGVVGLFVTEPTNFQTELHIGQVISVPKTTVAPDSCNSPLVEYRGECVDPIPACITPPKNVMPATCIDKIKDGIYTKNYNFQCLSGYTKTGTECLKNTSTTTPLSKNVCSNTVRDINGKYTIELLGLNGKRSADCRYTQWDFYILSGNAKLLSMNEYELTFDGTRRGKVRVTTTAPSNYWAEFEIGKSVPDTTVTPNSCLSPLVEYRGKCIDPIPACTNPPAHYIPASCIDKIENGKLIERYNFQCLSGYERIGDRCVSTATAVPIQTSPLKITKSNSGYNTTTSEYYFNLEWTAIKNAQYSVGYIIMDPNNSMLIGKSPGVGGISQPYTSITNIDPGYKYLVTLEAYDPIKQNFLGRDKVSIYVEKSVSAPSITSTTNIIIPPAGYEDEVRTGYSAAENPFDDVDTNTLTGLAASELYYRAIIGGYRNDIPNGKPIFDEYKSVNRAEAAKFLLLAKGIVFGSSSVGNPFKDVLEGQWYTEYVLKASNLGIINGHPDGTFRPAEGVQKDQFLKMIIKTFEIYENIDHAYTDVPNNAWFAPYAGAAHAYQMFPQHSKSQLNPGHQMTRGEVAIAIYQYLKNRNTAETPLRPPSGNQDGDSTSSTWKSHTNDTQDYTIEIPKTFTISNFDLDVTSSKIAISTKKGEPLNFFFDTEPTPMYDIANLKEGITHFFSLKNGYCDGPGCSEPLTAYLFYNKLSSTNIFVQFHWDTPTETTTKILKSFTFKNSPT
jgi:hypothetical protein